MSSFLKLEGITGEAGDLQHRGEFVIDDYQLGLNGIFGKNPVPENKPIITITRQTQNDSGKLFQACANGTIFPEGKIMLDVEKRGRIVTMSNISITSFQTPGTSQLDSKESISLAVEKYSVAPPK